MQKGKKPKQAKKTPQSLQKLRTSIAVDDKHGIIQGGRKKQYSITATDLAKEGTEAVDHLYRPVVRLQAAVGFQLRVLLQDLQRAQLPNYDF
ncbi:hypothetical protein ACLOJK_000972 [Asimina triloba]